MKAIHYACFKMEEKATKSILKIISAIGDKFTMSIRL